MATNIFLFLASGVINGEGFWLIDMKKNEFNILEENNLLECHRKELIGYESAKEILGAINLNINILNKEIKKQNISLNKPPKGISYDIPLNLLENIFDFWFEKYKDQELWNTCYGLLKLKQRVSLKSLINSDGIKGNSKKLAIEIEDLHNYKPNPVKIDIRNEPMWK